MAVSVFDIFKIGIGPSSSHTVGPMKAAGMFLRALDETGTADRVTGVRAELFGSLGATGHGHGSRPAVLLGLEGGDPATVDTARVPQRVAEIDASHRLVLATATPREIDFDPSDDLVMHRNKRITGHTNAMRFEARQGDETILVRTYWSIGGGMVLADDGSGNAQVVSDTTPVPYPFRTAGDLLERCHDNRLSIPEICRANEEVLARGTTADLLNIWAVMDGCITAGCATTGVLPGGLKVRRRAHRQHADLVRRRQQVAADPLGALDWLTVWALAVNEENAAGGRVVTAPTNGAAGIIPAVLKYVMTFNATGDAEADDAIVEEFLLTAAAIGSIYQQTASISGAEVGCQGEVGVACSMAAAALCHTWGGNAQQVMNAAEIGLEHHLGLTCDPVGGLVQIPCIERNAVAAVQAVTAARLALAGDGHQQVSLDQVIRTMMATGRDMSVKYKETARGGLAVNIVEC